ncbi:hypothetical protein [Weissella cibaria]|uniref:hypothetical protein n=1 Tax=Weissella cibaria TaxID=137591 RepID=UPI00106EAB71|nr:hypothetical protein [Weissella cibaria]
MNGRNGNAHYRQEDVGYQVAQDALEQIKLEEDWMIDFVKLLFGGALIGLFFALAVWWVFYIWQILLFQAL